MNPQMVNRSTTEPVVSLGWLETGAFLDMSCLKKIFRY